MAFQNKAQKLYDIVYEQKKPNDSVCGFHSEYSKGNVQAHWSCLNVLEWLGAT